MRVVTPNAPLHADVWGVGCLFGEMASGRALFPGRDTLDQLWLTMRTVGPLPLWQMQLLKQDEALAHVSIPSAAEIRPLHKRWAGSEAAASRLCAYYSL